MQFIDLSGPDGNAFVLLGKAKVFANQMELENADSIQSEMMSGDYNHLITTFEKYFSDVCELVNKPEEDEEDL